MKLQARDFSPDDTAALKKSCVLKEECPAFLSNESTTLKKVPSQSVSKPVVQSVRSAAHLTLVSTTDGI